MNRWSDTMDKATWIIFAQHRTDKSKNKYVVVRTDRDTFRDQLQERLDAAYPEFKHQNGRSVSGHVPVGRIDL